MSASRLAGRYAKSIIGLAIEKNMLERVKSDIDALQGAMNGNKDFKAVLKSPIISAEKKRSILKRIFGNNFSDVMATFIEIVLRKRREIYLPEIVGSFLEQYREHKGIVTASLVTASEVSDALIDKVRGIVLKDTGKTEVELDITQDVSLIGGFILRYEDKLYDASVSSKLNRLSKKFEENKYVRKI